MASASKLTYNTGQLKVDEEDVCELQPTRCLCKTRYGETRY